jgi:uncharacterized Ntn-hydrolase superfamily protein
MTYSIVARDASTGQLGVAVQTCWFAVGAIAPWARAGVGAVSTQAFAERAYGPRCLDALDAGAAPDQALAEARGLDPMPEVRQVGVVAADGSATAMTGEQCIDYAGHVVGDGFAVQANMMGSPDVWGAMAAEFERSSGSLARRLLAALEAGEAAGGDARGCMSAALVVVEGARSEPPGGGAVVDLRVDQSDDPLGELGGLLGTAEAFAECERGEDLLVRGDAAAAMVAIDRALEMLPLDENLRFSRAAALLASGDIAAGAAEVRSLVADRASWSTIVRSMATTGIVTLPDGVSVDSLFG